MPTHWPRSPVGEFTGNSAKYRSSTDLRDSSSLNARALGAGPRRLALGGGGACQLLPLVDGASRVGFFAHNPAKADKSFGCMWRFHVRFDAANFSGLHAADVAPNARPLAALPYRRVHRKQRKIPFLDLVHVGFKLRNGR